MARKAHRAAAEATLERPEDRRDSARRARTEVEFEEQATLGMLFGNFDANLVQLENRLGVFISARGNKVQIEGAEDDVARAREVLKAMHQRLIAGQELDAGAIEGMIAMSNEPTLEGIITGGDDQPPIMIRTRKKTITPRSAAQIEYMRALASRDIIFALGPAGTGKTYLAVAQAVSQLMTGSVQRLILSRPAVEAGEKIGFLPGDMKEKVDPYLRPLYDALYDCMPPEDVPHPLRHEQPHGGVRRSAASRHPGRPGKERVARCGRPARRRRWHCGEPLHRRRRGAPPDRRAHRGSVRGRRRLNPSMDLDVDIEQPWPPGEWVALAERAAEAAAKVAPELANPRLSASLLFTSDHEIHALNREWRQRDKPTNVLSFPMLERADLLTLAPDGPPEMLGDVALAHETCAREAAEKGIPLADHAAHLIVHGLLHLAGHDHETSPADAEAMEALEVLALERIGIADPYGG